MRSRDALFFGTLGYLLLPNALFLISWLRPEWGWPLAALLGAAVGLGYRNSTLPTGVTTTRRIQIFLALLALGYALILGVGEVGHQKADYDKHNLIFHDLITRPHPVVYENAAYGDPLLCYYLAYYLPTALAAKLAGGVALARWYSLVWGWLGLYLAFRWLHRLFAPHGAWVAGGFLTVSGLDLAVRNFWIWQELLDGSASRYLREYVLALGRGPALKFYVPPHLVFSNGLTQTQLNMPAPFTQFQWAPQHALGAWLAASLVVSEVQEKKSGRWLGLIAAATLLWTPFGAVGLVPLLVWAATRVTWRTFLSWENGLGVALTAVSGIYFLAHGPQQYAGFLFLNLQNGGDWLLYLVFMLAHVGVFATLLFWADRRFGILGDWRAGLLAATLGLLVSSLVFLGKYNDFLMRVSLPSKWLLTALLLYATAELWRRRHRIPALMLTGLLLFSAYYPLRETAISAWNLTREPSVKRGIARATLNFGEADVSRIAPDPKQPGADFAAQYLGSRESVFGEFLMKPTRKPSE